MFRAPEEEGKIKNAEPGDEVDDGSTGDNPASTTPIFIFSSNVRSSSSFALGKTVTSEHIELARKHFAG
jgi:hypothetical protein